MATLDPLTTFRPLHRRSVLGSAAALAGVLGAPAILRAAPAPVKLGILQPVTGALAQDGELGRLGAQLAVDEINAAGGLKALGGAPLEIVFADARSNPEVATQEVERLQNEGVVAIVGGFASPICLAASQAASRYNLPYNSASLARQFGTTLKRVVKLGLPTKQDLKRTVAAAFA